MAMSLNLAKQSINVDAPRFPTFQSQSTMEHPLPIC